MLWDDGNQTNIKKYRKRVKVVVKQENAGCKDGADVILLPSSTYLAGDDLPNGSEQVPWQEAQANAAAVDIGNR